MRSVTKKLGTYFQKSAGYKLIRSYKTDANEKDKLNDITHLVFVIHGIAHKLDSKKIIRNTSQFRDCVKWIKHKYFQGTEQRAEFVPVDWRSQCSFDGGLVEQITPLNLKNIRQILNSSAMDIMYYTSPIYSREIKISLANELNRLHSEFVERYPHDDFKVSIMAHSLGSVISYDIITGWEPFIERSDSSPIHLNFKLENFFCLGSPLSVFLALRQDEIFKVNLNLFPMSLAKKVYNIYHPTDPVAYRFEPLVAKHYCCYKPVGIQACGINCDYSEVPLELIENIDTVNTCPLSRNSTPVENLNHRLDYILRDSIGGSASDYLSMWYTHTSYWSNYDVAYFIYTRLFPEIDNTMEDFLKPEEKIPNFDLQLDQGNIIPSKNDISTPFNATTEGIDEGKFDQRWIVDYYREPFDKIFNNLVKNDGKVVRTAAKEEFIQSKLPDSVLSKIWKLADQDGDGLLDSDEFALAMYLIKIKLEGSELPDTLPKHLLPPSKSNNSLKIIPKDLGP